MNSTSFKVGTKIVEGGRVHRIFRSSKRKNLEGKPVQTIFFRPFFKIKSDNQLTSSIPLDMVHEARIRKPVTSKLLREIVSFLEKKTKKLPLDVDQLKNDMIKNDAETTANVLKKLWIDKQNKATSFSPTKRRIYEGALRSMVEEFALIKRTTVEKAEEKIFTSLEKSL